jgi:hypothetical protein
VYKVQVVNPDGTLSDQPVVVAQGAKLSGIALDREGNLYLGAHIYPEGQAVPGWVAKQQQSRLSLCESTSFVLIPKLRLGTNAVQSSASRRGSEASENVRPQAELGNESGLTRFPSHTYAQTGTVLKFPRAGGAIVADEAGPCTAYLYHRPSKVSLSGAQWARRVGFIPHKGTGCFCETMRIAMDGYDRLFVPDVATFSVYVLDKAGNVLTQFGEYGNMDSCRPGRPSGLPPQPEIGFAWPLAVDCGGEMAFVADQVNCRLVGVRFEHAAAAECDVDWPR